MTVDVNRCKHCGACAAVCPALNSGNLTDVSDAPDPFALWAEDSRIRLSASSGGAASVLGLTLAASGYTVLGASFDTSYRRVYHATARSPIEVVPMIGSKYVQSDTSTAFADILRSGTSKWVVFGTPCQISGLYNCLKSRHCPVHEYILVDFFCHGVASYLLWWAFIEDLYRRVGDILHLELRHKMAGWHHYAVYCVGTRAYRLDEFSKTHFGRFYLSNYCLRPTCYGCPYGKWSAADLRLGDFWGPEFASDFMGTSIAVPLSEKGLRLIESTRELGFRSVPKSWLLDSQARLTKSLVQKPVDSDIVLAKLASGSSIGRIYRQHLAWRYRRLALIRFPYWVALHVLPPSVRENLRFIRKVLRG